MLGTVAGTLEASQLLGIEVLLGEPTPDVMVWIPPRRG
jgi:hypothetical protein